MASDYGLNFGFRRSDESMATREGRFKTPATGDPLLIGTPVQLDPAAPGYLKVCGAAAKPLSGGFGLLVQEENHIPQLFDRVDAMGHDSYDLGLARIDQLSVMWAGVGTKVWYRNTDEYTRGTRHKDAVTFLLLTGVAVGDQLAWDGSKWIEAAAADTAWMTVTAVSGTTYCEAVLTF